LADSANATTFTQAPIAEPFEVPAGGIGDKAHEASPDSHRVDYCSDHPGFQQIALWTQKQLSWLKGD
jgi:hypothetical protein